MKALGKGRPLLGPGRAFDKVVSRVQSLVNGMQVNRPLEVQLLPIQLRQVNFGRANYKW